MNMAQAFRGEDYAGVREEGKRRIEVARRFEEPDRVPIMMSVAGSFFAHLWGANIRDYYTDIDTCIDVQLEGIRWCFEELQDDRTGYGLSLDLGPVGEALVFGMEIHYPDDTSPWGVRMMRTVEDIRRFEAPDVAKAPGVLWAFRRGEEFKARVKERGMGIGAGFGLGIHPPLSCACALAEPAMIYELMYTAPEVIHEFFEKLLRTFFLLAEFQDGYFGRRRTSCGLADDNSAFVSPVMYREFVLPYNKRIYDRYGQEGRHLHFDGPGDHLFEIIANELRVTQHDIGGFSEVAAAKRAYRGKVFFGGGFNLKSLYGTFEQAQPAVDRVIEIGGPGGGFYFSVGGETYVGANPETLKQVVAYVKKKGRYPIEGAREA